MQFAIIALTVVEIVVFVLKLRQKPLFTQNQQTQTNYKRFDFSFNSYLQRVSLRFLTAHCGFLGNPSPEGI